MRPSRKAEENAAHYTWKLIEQNPYNSLTEIRNKAMSVNPYKTAKTRDVFNTMVDTIIRKEEGKRYTELVQKHIVTEEKTTMQPYEITVNDSFAGEVKANSPKNALESVLWELSAKGANIKQYTKGRAACYSDSGYKVTHFTIHHYGFEFYCEEVG